jgi:RND superfamily putative drug exporter
MVIQVVPDGTAASPHVRDLVASIRAEVASLDGGGVRIHVGGETAEGVDGNQAIADGLPLVAATMLVVIYVLLLLTFRSVFLPLKAIAMNVASVAATYGVIVLVFQRGLGADLLGFESSGQVTNFVPVLLLTLLFSLSTDYEVFLLSRVREEWLQTGDDRVAVARGLALTAPLISGAAVLMVAVFSAFALASVLPVQELGLGMAVAIVLDATLVRLVLVPASMRLMGRWNWWHPTLPRSAEWPEAAVMDPS